MSEMDPLGEKVRITIGDHKSWSERPLARKRKPRDLSHNWPGNDSWMGNPLNAWVAIVALPLIVYIGGSLLLALIFGP